MMEWQNGGMVEQCNGRIVEWWNGNGNGNGGMAMVMVEWQW